MFRAKLILMLAEGVPFATIKERLQTTAPTISRWKQRFLEDGLEGLDTYHPGQSAMVQTAAREDPGRDAPKTERWFHPLELPKAGRGDPCQ